VAVALTGPVGATVSFSDLYGRDILNSLGVIPLSGSTFNPGDLDDNGIPDFNDGIGAIRFSGTDTRTSFTMIGGKLGTATTLPDGADSDRTGITRLIPNIFWESATGVTWTIADDPKGLYDEWESQAGFGFAGEIRQTTFTVTGLPPGSGSVVVGSPIVRAQNAYNPTSLPGGTNVRNFSVTSGFATAGQGVFISDGGSIGSINIAGMLFGASNFNGYVNRLSVGTLYGSVSVAGDIGSIIVAGDAGIWSPDRTFTAQSGLRLDPNNKTNANTPEIKQSRSTQRIPRNSCRGLGAILLNIGSICLRSFNYQEWFCDTPSVNWHALWANLLQKLPFIFYLIVHHVFMNFTGISK
jgi:hypothetical protein